MKPTSTIKCACGCEHQLFWLMSGPKRKELVYQCNKIEKVRKTGKKQGESYHGSGIIFASEDIVVPAGLPEQLTPNYRKKLQAQKQYQLLLMK